MKVKYNPRKNAVVASVQLGNGEVELGFISVGVSQATLSSFKEDMERQADDLHRLSESKTDVKSDSSAKVSEQLQTALDMGAVHMHVSELTITIRPPLNEDLRVWCLPLAPKVVVTEGSEVIWEGVRNEGSLLEARLRERLSFRRYLSQEHIEAYLDLVAKQWNQRWAEFLDWVRKGLEIDRLRDEPGQPYTLRFQEYFIAEDIREAFLQHYLEQYVSRLGCCSTNLEVRELASALVGKYRVRSLHRQLCDDKPKMTLEPVSNPPVDTKQPVETEHRSERNTKSDLQFSQSSFVEALLALPIELSTKLLGKTRKGYNVIQRKYVKPETPDAVCFSIGKSAIDGGRMVVITNTGDLTKVVHSALPALSKGLGVTITQELRVVVTKLIELLLQNTTAPKRGAVYCDWSEVLMRELSAEDFSKVRSLLPGNIKPSDVERHDANFVTALLRLPETLVYRLLGKTKRGSSVLHRRGNNNDDSVAITHKRADSNSYTLAKVSGDVSDTALRLCQHHANRSGIELTPDFVVVVTKLVDLLLKNTKPVTKGSVECDWYEVLKADLSPEDFAIVETYLPARKSNETTNSTVDADEVKDTPTEPTPDAKDVGEVVVLGFQTKPALAKMDVLPKGTDFAVKNWPWFFDESGKFDLLQLCRKGERFSVMAKCKPKGRNTNCVKRTEIDIDTTYVSVRNAVITAYAAAVFGTGIENYPAVEELFKEYCDAFTVAALTELNLNGILPKKDSQKVSSELVPTYLNFQDALDPDQILEKLTYPSGRLRVVSVGKSTEGVFWYVKANKIGMGPSIKPKRVRFTEKQLDEQINELTDEIKRLTNLPDNPSLIFEVKSILYREANRVKHGLI